MADSHGTLLLSVRTDDGLYLAADSRSTNPPSDQAQKIFRCGRIGFIGVCGTVVIRAALPGEPVAMLDVMAALHQITAQFDPGGDDLVEYVALCSYKALKPFWARHVEPAPAAFLASGLVNESICTIPVACINNGRLQVSEIDLRLSPTGELLAPSYRERSDEIIGWGDVPADSNGIPTPSNSTKSVLRYIEAVYELAARTRPETIGGQIDIGYVSLDSAKWLRWKGFN